MRKRLIKTLYFEDGKLYGTTNGRRFLLADCKPKIELYEHQTDVPTLGKHGATIKRHHVTVVICGDMDYTRKVNEEFLQTVTEFELAADIQREDGVFENIVFKNLDEIEVDLDADWIFEIDGQTDLVKKLLSL